MDSTVLLPALGGLVAGLLLALIGSTIYLRAGRRNAAALLSDAESKALATLKAAAHDSEQAKAAATLEGKMEALRLREEAEREDAKRRGLDGSLAVRLMEDRVSVSREFRKMEPGALQLDISAGLSGAWSGAASGRLSGGLVEAGVAALCALLRSDR